MNKRSAQYNTQSTSSDAIPARFRQEAIINGNPAVIDTRAINNDVPARFQPQPMPQETSTRRRGPFGIGTNL